MTSTVVLKRAAIDASVSPACTVYLNDCAGAGIPPGVTAATTGVTAGLGVATTVGAGISPGVLLLAGGSGVTFKGTLVNCGSGNAGAARSQPVSKATRQKATTAPAAGI